MATFHFNGASFFDRLPAQFVIIKEHPYISCILLICGLCIATRLLTGLRTNFQVSDDPSQPRRPPPLPYWVPFAGHILEFIADHLAWMSRNRAAYPTGIYAIKMGPSTHNVITAPSLVSQLLAPRTPISQDQFLSYVLRHVFSDQGATQDLIDRGLLIDGPHKVLYGMMRDPVLGLAGRILTGALEEHAFDIISGNGSLVDQHVWERSARMELIPPGEPGAFRAGRQGVTVSLHRLVRDWVGWVGINSFMGRAFLENNPNFLADFWKFDEKMPLFLTGLPYWVVPTLPPAALCRERIVNAVAEHHEAMIKLLDGQDPGSKYDEMSDVSTIMWDRVKVYREYGVTGRKLGASDLAIVWAITANAAQVAFWLVYRVLAAPGLLAEIREEIAPYVRMKQLPNSGLPFQDLPKLEIDGNGLREKCPLLKGALYETLRLDSSSMVYKLIQKDFVIQESEEDAKIVGKSSAESYLLKKGEFACLPGGVHGEDSRYFKDPAKFDARRFWTKSKDSNGEEVIKIDYGTLRPWGGGHTICKGRNYAEQEMTFFAAVLLSCYDIEPADGKGFKPLAKKPQAGTYVPKKDIRVKMWKRTKW